MKLHVVLFLLLLGMCCVIGIVLLTPEPAGGLSDEHPTFGESMQRARAGAERHAQVRWFGMALGLLEIGFFVCCLVMGLGHSCRTTWPYWIAGAGYAAIFCLMVLADSFYVQQQAPQLFGGFPWPTFLMLFGLGGLPIVFVLFYIVNFDRWILDPEDLQRFRESLHQREQARRED